MKSASEEEKLELSSPVEEVPFLAIKAAEELDELLRKRKTSLGAVKRLVEVLKKSLSVNNTTGPKTFVDASNIAVFSRAYDGWEPENKIATTTDLVAQAANIVRGLEESSGRKKNEIEKLRDFCLALAEAAASYREAEFRYTQTVWS